MRDNMKRRELKRKEKNRILKLKLTEGNIDDVYKSLPKIVKVCNKKYKIELFYNNDFVDIYCITENSITDKRLIDIIEVVHAINLKNIREKFNYIYDAVCAKLDERRKTNYCEFENDMCVRDRKRGNDHNNGCCECKGRGKCQYLDHGVCTLDSCMACKLFTCPTLKTMGITQSINDFVLTKCFFTNRQKDILQFSYWTPKELIIEKLVKSSKRFLKV